MRDEGCLDVYATDFDLSADKPCGGCCTYPTLTYVLTQKWDDINFVINDTFFDKNLKPFIIKDIRYFLSSWIWQNNSGEIYSADSLEASCGVSSIVYPADVHVVSPQQFTYFIDTVRITPHIDSIQFQFGLSKDYSCLDKDDTQIPSSLTSNSLLWNDDDSLLHDIRLIVNLNPADTLLDTLFLDITHPFTLPYAYDFEKGKNHEFRLTVNYALWFKEVNIFDPESWRMSIEQGLEGSFYKTE
jgi:hypothetical protein